MSITLPSLRDLSASVICSSLLYDIGEDGIVQPKPHLLGQTIQLDADNSQLLLNHLRSSHRLTLPLLELFNSVPITELSLAVDYTSNVNSSASSSSTSLLSSKPPTRLQNATSSAVMKQFRIDDSWLEVLSQHHTELRSLELTFGYGITDQGLNKIISALSGLVRLDLGRCRKLTDKSLENLSKLPLLTSLCISATQATTRTIRNAICTLSNLTCLDICSNFCVISLEEIANGLPSLQVLSAAATKINDEGFCHVSKLTKLEKLDISFSKISSEGVKSIENLTNLTSLNLSLNSQIDGSICPILANLTSLTSLSLSAIDLSDPANSLYFLTTLPSLENLDLSRAGFRDVDALPLAKIKSLKRLSMSYTYTSDFLLTALCEGDISQPQHPQAENTSEEPLPPKRKSEGEEKKGLSLEELNITLCPAVSDIGVATLSSMTSLTSLCIGSPQITNRSVENLLLLTNLQKLEIWETRITFDVLVAVRSKLPYLSPLDDRITTSAGTFIFAPQDD